MKRTTVINAFQPSKELDDPDRFAGRRKQIIRLTDSLQSHGAVPLIYGDRGLGKSSLAVQLKLIAMGHVELLHRINAERFAPPEEYHYLTFYVTCTDLTKSFLDLLQVLVNSAESVEHEDTKAKATKLVDRTTRTRLSLKAFQLENSKRYETESRRLNYQDLNLEEKLVQLCDTLTSVYNCPVLFVIDELDRMKNTEGLASFLKAASSETLKFLLVGIASNVSDLLTDHKSLECRLQPIRVPLMDSGELG